MSSPSWRVIEVRFLDKCRTSANTSQPKPSQNPSRLSGFAIHLQARQDGAGRAYIRFQFNSRIESSDNVSLYDAFLVLYIQGHIDHLKLVVDDRRPGVPGLLDDMDAAYILSMAKEVSICSGALHPRVCALAQRLTRLDASADLPVLTYVASFPSIQCLGLYGHGQWTSPEFLDLLCWVLRTTPRIQLVIIARHSMERSRARDVICRLALSMRDGTVSMMNEWGVHSVSDAVCEGVHVTVAGAVISASYVGAHLE